MDNASDQDFASVAVRSEGELRRLLSLSGWLVSIPVSTFPSSWLYEGDCRLDGGFYTSEAMAARALVLDSGLSTALAGRVTKDIFYLERFSRVYSKTSRDGVAFLTPSLVLHFRPQSDKYLANSSGMVHACTVAKGTILITRSGSVGRCIIAGERLSQFTISDDLIRVIPDDIPVGYLYAFLSSHIGQTLLTKDQYGSAIKHLEPHHIRDVPVPLAPDDIQQDIHDSIMRAYGLRDEANALLDEADELLHNELGIPRFEESMVKYLPIPSIPSTSPLGMPPLKAFTVSSVELDERFDGSYHVPIARAAIAQLQLGKYSLSLLGDIAQRIYIPPRFKRIYVTEGYGVPFLRPSHLPQYRPIDLGYIAESTDVLEQLRLRQGEVMLVTDGTVGTVSLVSSRTDGWAGSNNIGRISYGDEEKDLYRNGFLAAFLMTPYGYYQVARVIYGSVIDHIEEIHIKRMLIPEAPLDVQVQIGRKIVDAFEKKDEAAIIEQQAIKELEQYIEQSHQRHTNL